MMGWGKVTLLYKYVVWCGVVVHCTVSWCGVCYGVKYSKYKIHTTQ